MSSPLKRFPTDLEKNPAPPFHEPIQILLAEDDDGLREILQEYLNKPGRVIHSHKDGLKAIEALKGAFFDLVMTDLVMPGADGIQILREVKHSHPESIVIIMTGYASLDTAIEAIRGGAYDYIPKPFRLDELEVVINNACEKINLMRENRRLLQRLKETMGKLEELRKTWERNFTHFLDSCWTVSGEHEEPEMEILLNQINPMSPDYQGGKGLQEKSLDSLERLARLRKEGFLSDDEFLSLKKVLLKKLDTV